MNTKIEIIQDDITTLAVDAIVNAANCSLCGGGGVDGAIHRAAGPELLELCRTFGGCSTGDAVITPGFNLLAKYIIHTPGPVWDGGDNNEEALLETCYRNCMDRALENGCRSIAFPAISCGIYRFPIDKATAIALKTVNECINNNPGKFDLVQFVCFDQKTEKHYQRSWEKLYPDKSLTKTDDDYWEKMTGALFGAVVGDALGVPVEFQSGESLKINPVTNMRGYGTHNQPAGTWSDDSSMMLCSIESLLNGYDPNDMMERFSKWSSDGYMSAHGYCFDIGNTVSMAISRYNSGFKKPWGGTDDYSNGNGSLMRILPIALLYKEDDAIIDAAYEVSALTHAHIRAQICCAIYCLIIRKILNGMKLVEATESSLQEMLKFIPENELEHFQGLLSILDTKEEKTGLFSKLFKGDSPKKLWDYPESQIKSGGYVMETMEAALWCCYNSSSYKEAVLKAVNLGHDTDTTGMVAGGLAGAMYGILSIPPAWINQLAKVDMLRSMFNKFIEKSSQNG